MDSKHLLKIRIPTHMNSIEFELLQVHNPISLRLFFILMYTQGVLSSLSENSNAVTYRGSSIMRLIVSKKIPQYSRQYYPDNRNPDDRGITILQMEWFINPGIARIKVIEVPNPNNQVLLYIHFTYLLFALSVLRPLPQHRRTYLPHPIPSIVYHLDSCHYLSESNLSISNPLHQEISCA